MHFRAMQYIYLGIFSNQISCNMCHYFVDLIQFVTFVDNTYFHQVYEYDDDGQLVINAQNCVHCKCCSIKVNACVV